MHSGNTCGDLCTACSCCFEGHSLSLLGKCGFRFCPDMHMTHVRIPEVIHCFITVLWNTCQHTRREHLCGVLLRALSTTKLAHVLELALYARQILVVVISTCVHAIRVETYCMAYSCWSEGHTLSLLVKCDLRFCPHVRVTHVRFP